jgi:hypothetical protein
MTRPDFHVVWQAKKLATRPKEIFGTTTGEITACGADVYVEKRITTEYII